MAAKPKLPAAVGTSLRVLGWGSNGTPGNSGMDVLQEASLRLQSLATCQEFNPKPEFGDFGTNTNICAGNGPSFLDDVCSGDSGAPRPSSLPPPVLPAGLAAHCLLLNLASMR